MGEDHLEDEERDGRIILQHISVKLVVRWLELVQNHISVQVNVCYNFDVQYVMLHGALRCHLSSQQSRI